MLHLIFNIFLEFTENRKLKTEALPGGGREIRTPGPLKVCGFQDRRLKPLGHPSCPKFLPSASRDVNLGAQEGRGYGLSCRGGFLTRPYEKPCEATTHPESSPPR